MERKSSNWTAAVLLLVLGASSLTATAQSTYYRWTDENGNTIYSDRTPPAGVDYEVVSTRANLSREVEASEGAVPASVSPEDSEEFQESAAQAQQRTVTEKNPEYCTQAQQNLSNLNTYARIRIKGADGEYRYLSEEEKAEQRRQAEQAIADYCE